MASFERHLKAEAGRPPARGQVGLLALLVGALVFAVGVGSGRSLAHVGGPGRLVNPRSFASDLLVVGLAVVGLTAAVLVYSSWPGRRRRSSDDEPELVYEGQRSRSWTAALALLLAGAAFAGLVVALVLLSHHHSQTEAPPPVTVPLRPIPPHSGSGGAGAGQSGLPPVHWWGLAGVALVLLLAAALIWRTTRRRPHAITEEDATEEAEALRGAIEISLEDIEREQDPRRAVIRAYARMEQVLGRHGLARRPFETSLEYLRRALATLRVSSRAVQRLAELFERAKFSTHEIDLTMKHDALSALAAVRDELEHPR